MRERAVLISVKEKWAERILTGEKTVEVRKTVPKLETPFTCYIYQSGTGFIVGEFVCDKLIWVIAHPAVFAGYPTLFAKSISDACMTQDEAEAYSGGKDLYGWHIAEVRRYETPVPLECFGLRRPPVSWRYVIGRDCHAACGCSQ